MHSCKSVHELSYQQERGGVSYGESVKFPVVLYQAKVTILLLNEKEGERVGRFRLSDVPLVQIFRKEGLYRYIFSRG